MDVESFDIGLAAAAPDVVVFLVGMNGDGGDCEGAVECSTKGENEVLQEAGQDTLEQDPQK